MLTLLKILLSIPIAYGLMYPVLNPDIQGGILGEVQMLGTWGSFGFIAVFLYLVFLYARDLKRSLELVSGPSRQAKPNSVWWMFVLPYNFIEDFFIIYHVNKSLQIESKTNSSLSSIERFGWISGYGWCGAQIISLIPNEIGSTAGLLAIVLWVIHWRFVRSANRLLANNSLQSKAA